MFTRVEFVFVISCPPDCNAVVVQYFVLVNRISFTPSCYLTDIDVHVLTIEVGIEFHVYPDLYIPRDCLKFTVDQNRFISLHKHFSCHWNNVKQSNFAALNVCGFVTKIILLPLYLQICKSKFLELMY